MNHDLIIIGAGPGGYQAAAYAAHNGLSVLIVEQAQLGGTCLNVGCIPTKTLCRNAEVVELLRDAQQYGITHQPFSIDFQAMQQRKEDVITTLRNGIQTILQHPGIQVLQGKATFVDDHTIAVGDEQFSAPNIIIATGSVSKSLPVPGIDQPNVLSSTSLLDIDALPTSLVVVGAGVIGMEMASVFAALGTKVSVIEFLPECLPALDDEVARRLRQVISRRLNIDFYMQTALKAIEGNTVIATRKGKDVSIEAQYVLIATGRQANTQGLQLENTSIAHSPKGIEVDDHLMTSVNGVYAIGDVNGRAMLAHAAHMQARRAVNHILKRSDTIRLDVMPGAIFTHPEAASVGPTEKQLVADGVPFVCKKVHYRANGKALADNQTDGLLKLIASDADANGDQRILACHVCGAHAADIVQEVAALICRDTTVQQLADITHIHPTVNEILQEAALGF